jgi:hypothetical protein
MRVAFAAGLLDGYDSELSDHYPAGPSMTSILHEEKAFTARHDANAETR